MNSCTRESWLILPAIHLVNIKWSDTHIPTVTVFIEAKANKYTNDFPRAFLYVTYKLIFETVWHFLVSEATVLALEHIGNCEYQTYRKQRELEFVAPTV